MPNSLKIVYISVLIIISCQFIHCNDSDSDGTADKLIFAHTLCRHGDREMLEPYPTMIKSGQYSLTEDQYGQLTNRGKRQLFKLGRYLRKRYRTLLGNGVYSANKVYIQSTDTDRALMSAEAAMAALFRPSGNQVWNKKLKWQPIPIHTVPRTEDTLLASEKRCDHFDYVMVQYMNTTEYTELFTKHKTLIDHLAKNSGRKLDTITDIFMLYDALWIEKKKGNQLPEWVGNAMEIGGDFEYLAMCYFNIFTPTTEMKKLKSGFLLKDILDRFMNKTQSTLSPNRSLWLYFAHDITLSNMLNTLGVFKLHQPRYASCLLFELYESDQPYIQIFYKKTIKMKKSRPLEIDGCGSKCPLKKFYSLYQNILPTENFNKECELRDGEILHTNPENLPY